MFGSSELVKASGSQTGGSQNTFKEGSQDDLKIFKIIQTKF